MAEPPGGTVTFVFTDIEGSTRRWDAQPDTMLRALQRHDAILRKTIERHGGHIFKLGAARPLASEAVWPESGRNLFRTGSSTGDRSNCCKTDVTACRGPWGVGSPAAHRPPRPVLTRPPRPAGSAEYRRRPRRGGIAQDGSRRAAASVQSPVEHQQGPCLDCTAGVPGVASRRVAPPTERVLYTGSATGRRQHPPKPAATGVLVATSPVSVPTGSPPMTRVARSRIMRQVDGLLGAFPDPLATSQRILVRCASMHHPASHRALLPVLVALLPPSRRAPPRRRRCQPATSGTVERRVRRRLLGA